MLVQPDGKLLITGNFSSIQDFPTLNVARINVDDSLDRSFKRSLTDSYLVGDTLECFASPAAIALQSDGKILISALVYRLPFGTDRLIMRFNADGSLDRSFNSGIGPNSLATSIAVQPDGKVLIAGRFFNTVSGRLRNRVARLNADGRLDDPVDLCFRSKTLTEILR